MDVGLLQHLRQSIQSLFGEPFFKQLILTYFYLFLFTAIAMPAKQVVSGGGFVGHDGTQTYTWAAAKQLIAGMTNDERKQARQMLQDAFGDQM